MNYNYKEDIEEQRTPVERIEAATDLLEQALDEIAPLHDTELTHYVRQGANKLQRRRREIFDNARAVLDRGRKEAGK